MIHEIKEYEKTKEKKIKEEQKMYKETEDVKHSNLIIDREIETVNDIQKLNAYKNKIEKALIDSEREFVGVEKDTYYYNSLNNKIKNDKKRLKYIDRRIEDLKSFEKYFNETNSLIEEKPDNIYANLAKLEEEKKNIINIINNKNRRRKTDQISSFKEMLEKIDNKIKVLGLEINTHNELEKGCLELENEFSKIKEEKIERIFNTKIQTIKNKIQTFKEKINRVITLGDKEKEINSKIFNIEEEIKTEIETREKEKHFEGLNSRIEKIKENVNHIKILTIDSEDNLEEKNQKTRSRKREIKTNTVTRNNWKHFGNNK